VDPQDRRQDRHVNLTDDQAARYRPWFANAQALRTLISELKELSLRIASQAEGWR